MLLLGVGISGLVAETAFTTYMFAKVWVGNTAIDRLLATIAASSVVYGGVFLLAILVYNHDRFARAWGVTDRLSPIRRRVVVGILFGSASLSVLVQIVWVVNGFIDSMFAIRNLLSMYPIFGLLTAAVWLMPTTPVASARPASL